MLLALVLASALGGGAVYTLLVIGAVFATLAAVALLVALRLPGAAPSFVAMDARRPLREVWTGGQVRVLAGLVFVGFGVFIALTTWLQALLDHYGVSANAAGAVLVAMPSSASSAPRSWRASAARCCSPGSTCSPSTPSSTIRCPHFSRSRRAGARRSRWCAGFTPTGRGPSRAPPRSKRSARASRSSRRRSGRQGQ
ncbi:MAG: hypothetical protein M3071_14825 [Actinomycetota bacterium]|nr:hypothetical protein [Actinomycetota bacterium]